MKATTAEERRRRHENIDDAVEYISGRDKPLALYLYSDDEDTVDMVLRRTSSGGVTINGFFMHYLGNKLPFRYGQLSRRVRVQDVLA